MLSEQRGGELERPALLCAIQVSTDLGLIVVVVAGFRGYFDFSDVRVLCYIRCPLHWNSTSSDAGGYTLHKFELWNLPIVDRFLLSLATSGPKLQNDILVCVELTQSIVNEGYVAIINSTGLSSVTEVHKSTNCSQKFSGGWPTDHTHKVTLDITMDATGNLFQFGDTALVVLKPYNRL